MCVLLPTTTGKMQLRSQKEHPAWRAWKPVAIFGTKMSDLRNLRGRELSLQTMATRPPTSPRATMDPRPRVKLPTVRTWLIPEEEILTSPRPGLHPAHPCPHRPTSTFLPFPATHSIGTSSHPTYCSKLRVTYVKTDEHCSVSRESATTGVECLSNALSIGPKSRPSILQSCLNCGCSGPEVCPSTQKYLIFLHNCTVNLHVRE